MFDRLLKLLQGLDPGPMTEEEWMSLLWEAHTQRVLGLVSDATASLGLELPFAAAGRLMMETDFIEQRNKAVNSAAGRLTEFFTGKGLHPVIQKGPAVAALYDNPLHRESGDIDFFFNGEEFERARQQAGTLATLHDESDGAFWYKYDGVTIEHHPRYYDSACQFPELEPGCPESQMIMLSVHILKHALGRGIGLKQIIDYRTARRKLDFDGEIVAELMRRAGLGRWQSLLDDFGPDLKAIVSRQGNFGRKTKGTSRIETAKAFLRKIPFALKYAPREWLHTVIVLSRPKQHHFPNR